MENEDILGFFNFKYQHFKIKIFNNKKNMFKFKENKLQEKFRLYRLKHS